DKGDGNASISFEAVKDGNSVLNLGTIDFNGNLTVPLDGNTWTHVLVHLYRGNNSYVQIAGFKNGQEVHSTSNYYYDFQDLLYTLRGREIIIGTQRKDVANDTQYKGYLDEVLFLNGSASTGKMSSSHVAELYNNGYNLINPSNYFGTAYGFQADYNFNQNSGLPVDEIGGVTATEMTGAIWVTE
ncbi:MAG: hypothetical protein VW963_09535, partial [Candidatus Neomarinimicrobiota bacterium]